ncbi:acetyl-CoA C-acetyltransferase/acetyl-CoA acyltransferase [Variovorax boronicumulans]|uniref:Acetyl-CoA C-acetyltransferase/acetyl-CoA acyltransferase n=1 Tax=Variovorax boronicumulans TaxID=436515 RepID=A0AAW8DU14_9BURK|nr:thiolase family protein [Variovorax boronicumulans]MDP9877657.1 acetyl-CoA C-acetyltransferase/acetyl-CoA acyltransferase [Variovorax boronicumulans]MDP9922942.1 acetyl-CoA C-acetyltransferase/acetyl-CoA acyltransferase [Variovorax boronicumulans]
MQQAFIIDAVRSPLARSKPGAAFAELHATELLAQVLAGLVQRNKLDPGMVDDVLTGCVSQVGDQSSTPGRVAWLAAGFPEHVPATTIDRRCGSGQQAVHFAAQGIMAGAYDIVIASGIESMSRVKMGSARMGQRPFGPSIQERYAPGLVSQGVAAELLAARYGLSRRELDSYSARSHHLAHSARESGAFRREIVPIQTQQGVVDCDETIRPHTHVDGLATLEPAFRDADISKRFPQIQWNITAGNSSQLSDGASAMLLMSESAASRLGLTPRARFVAFDVIGDDPITMMNAPIPSSRRILKKSGLSIDEISHYEINEAFASVPLAWQRELGGDLARLNPRGGAIALGHPLGASGVRLMTTMLHALEDNGGRYGLQSMCEAMGMANSTILERL